MIGQKTSDQEHAILEVKIRRLTRRIDDNRKSWGLIDMFVNLHISLYSAVFGSESVIKFLSENKNIYKFDILENYYRLMDELSAYKSFFKKIKK